jgi:hypothetical protein
MPGPIRVDNAARPWSVRSNANVRPTSGAISPGAVYV